jgi:hypothetical protein
MPGQCMARFLRARPCIGPARIAKFRPEPGLARPNAKSANDSTTPEHGSTEPVTYVAGMALLLALITPYVIIGGLTGFQRQQSTQSQCIWIMCWLIISQVYGYFLAEQTMQRFITKHDSEPSRKLNTWVRALASRFKKLENSLLIAEYSIPANLAISSLIPRIPALGGVAEMMGSYGLYRTAL